MIGEQFGVRVEKGPKDLREIPRYFGRAAAARDYGAWDIEIVAEINNAPRLTREAIRSEARRTSGTSGADVIDIGCTPGLVFPALGDVVRELVADGMRVSVDTFDPDEIRAAVARRRRAGAERERVEHRRRATISPAPARAWSSFPTSAARSTRWSRRSRSSSAGGVPYLIDPILEPIGFGFMASLERYAEVRRRYPDAEMLMGIGNLTELTAADSTGVNALLIAVCQELGVRAVLTTEVIPWARGAVREVDVARRLMHYAMTQRTIPKGVDDRLVTVKDPAVLTYTEAELRALQAGITDPNFRIFADREGITVLNNERFVRGTDIHGRSSRSCSGRADARLLPGQGAGAREPRRHAGQDVSSGRGAVVGISHAAGRCRRRSTSGSRSARSCGGRHQARTISEAASCVALEMSNRVTPVVEELVPASGSGAVCERLAGLPYRLWLDSAAISVASRAGYSFVTADPVAGRAEQRTVTVVEIVDRRVRAASVDGDALAAVRHSWRRSPPSR